MKRFIAILLIPIYLIMGCGFLSHTHLCGGEVAAIRHFKGTPQNDSFCACGMSKQKMPKGCCADKVEVKKITESFFADVNLDLDSFKIIGDLPLSYYWGFNISDKLPSVLIKEGYFGIPPPVPDDLYLLYCSLITYG